MSEKMDKVLQIRLSSKEHEMIKRAFIGTNISNMVRMYLINEAEKILERYDEVVKIYKDFEKEKKAIEQYLKLQMKNYEIAYVGDRKITWKKQERNIIDTTRLKKEHPEIVVGYMKTTTSRVLKII